MVKHKEEGEEEEYGTNEYQYKNLKNSIIAYIEQEEIRSVREKSFRYSTESLPG